jgi:peptidoglycan/LPS O-acetylase OafA/YrhL
MKKTAERRLDIDGLRGVAIVLVVLYHFCQPDAVAALSKGRQRYFSGGFIGVDVFFVLSGFLITHKIVHQTQPFSYAQFIAGRCQRLLPAMLVSVLLLFLLACETFILCLRSFFV